MKKQIKSSTLAILSLICVTVITMISYAYFTSSSSVTNTVNVGDVNIEVVEEFTLPKEWNGSSYPKLVKIQNNSKSDALIRVALVPRWVDSQGNAWPGDTSIIVLKYENILQSPSTTPENKWIKGEDGYFYYNTMVPMGNTTVEILSSVMVQPPENLKDRYKDKTLIVDVKAEAIQATKIAYREAWSSILEGSNLQKMLDSLCAR